MFPSLNDGPGCVMTLDVWTKSQSSTPIRYHDGQPHRTARKDSFNFHARLNEGQLAVTLMPKAKDKTAFSHPYHLHSVLTELRKVWLTQESVTWGWPRHSILGWCGLREQGWSSLALTTTQWQEKQVSAFSVLANYYKRFVPNFSSAPLSDLLIKEQTEKGVWTVQT